jgi:hypothetical protein
MPDPERQRAGRLGGLTSWRQIPDRYERMAHVRENSPAAATEAEIEGLPTERFLR